jgi:PPK2 family polyphosphate:nucleotide phosphotransferase
MDPQEYLVPPKSRVRLDTYATTPQGGMKKETDARRRTKEQAERLARCQDILHAHAAYGLLIILQGMDAAGKDETIQEVFSSLDPQVCQAMQFKTPTETERGHDYLWRAVQALPGRGEMRVFNRSYYEQVTSEKAYPDLLEVWDLPPEAREDLWSKRYQQINNFERHLVENGFPVIKFFLHVSRETERERLLERIGEPEQQWQFSETDLRHYQDWDKLQETFDAMLSKTSTPWAPWYVIPADQRAATYAAVASILVERMEQLHDGYPALDDEAQEVLERARAELERDD